MGAVPRADFLTCMPGTTAWRPGFHAPHLPTIGAEGKIAASIGKDTGG